ncbi:MAG: hypothetical protein ABSA39_10750 [Edaphobacter sp.]
MRPVIFLRIASVLTLIHAVLHTLGGVFGAMPPAALAIVAAMKANAFPAMGVMRTMWDFHMGLGLVVSVALTMEGIVFWQLGTLAKSEPFRLRPILTTFLVGYLCIPVISCRYFFAGPMITEILIALCLLIAIVGAKQMAEEGVGSRVVA